MDVSLCLECWLQVVMDNSQEAKQRKLDSEFLFVFLKGGVLWDNGLVPCHLYCIILIKH